MTHRISFALVAVWLLTLPFLGCQRGDSLEFAPVSGTVTFDDVPLTHGRIQFMPDHSKGTHGPMATGQIAADGTFVLMTSEPDDGAQVGFYQVAVNCWEEISFDPKNPRPTPPPKSLIPERYANERTSGLTAEVKSGEPNTFAFSLKR